MTPEQIKFIRTTLGRTQQDMARIAGVSLSVWKTWESGVGTPKRENMTKLLKLHHHVVGREGRE